MAYIEGHARDQALLPPASVEDYVAADSPVRFIDAFVDDLDPGEAGFHRARPKATVSCPLLSGPSTMRVWIKEGTTDACQKAQARRDHRQAA